MKKVKQINNWIIKEKREDEVLQSVPLEQRFAVFSPYGIFQEDNLTLEQAETFCRENLDHCKNKFMGMLKRGAVQ